MSTCSRLDLETLGSQPINLHGHCMALLKYGHFQLRIKFWPLDGIVNCLIRLVMKNHISCHFNFQNQA